MRRKGLVVAERVVEQHASTELHVLQRAAALQRQQEWEGRDQMRRNAEQRLPLAQIQTDQPDIAHRQIAEPAMDQTSRRGRRAAAEVIPLDQRDAESRPRRVGALCPRRQFRRR